MWLAKLLLSVALVCAGAKALQVGRLAKPAAGRLVRATSTFKLFEQPPPHERQAALSQDPLLLRAARGEKVERTPVWMMRQAGRHMKAYRELCKTHRTFRERSEVAEVAIEISLQPWRAYGTDGCILFSDILTPLPGMGVDFDILEKEGPKIKPITSMEDVRKIRAIDPHRSTPFVAEALQGIRKAVAGNAAVLGFVGLPYTLASYLVEGGPTTEYQKIKTMSYEAPHILLELLDRLANNIADYAIFQIEQGAQVIQVFDSWAGVLSPVDYDRFAGPFQQQVIQRIKQSHPDVPIILYINRSGALLERMATSGADIISLDWTVTLSEARRRLGSRVGVQGNLDPMLLFAPDEVIKSATEDILRQGWGARHIMNLGHGIDATTSEAKAKLFVDTVKSFRM